MLRYSPSFSAEDEVEGLAPREGVDVLRIHNSKIPASGIRPSSRWNLTVCVTFWKRATALYLIPILVPPTLKPLAHSAQ